MIDTLIRSHAYKIDAQHWIVDALEEEKELFLDEIYSGR